MGFYRTQHQEYLADFAISDPSGWPDPDHSRFRHLSKRSFFSRQATQGDHISPMMKEHKPPTRHRAMGMVKGGMTQGQAARELGVDVATVGRWLAGD